MNPTAHFTFTTAIASALEASGVVTATVFAQGSTVETVTPALAVSAEDTSSAHTKLHQGSLVLAFRFDPDATSATDAGSAAGAASDWLLSEDGRAAARAACLTSNLWLRILGPATSAGLITLGDRSRAFEIRLPYWIQTAL